ncbi:exonuclease V a 5' deoxyribonuclease-domain-containing protein [Stachybotrys elegans]|uniref:Exonuclease V a 5' deoxyribonuclease-domain-containing protein n=1 Tax=Stachybotrys elegans TaxID=80388 RepID=A0A8K0SRZ7_9HYPO|nr:exonuclease V a 5' deoxyribonuclease-domain-containing protein [Stachybotrys elegans]
MDSDNDSDFSLGLSPEEEEQLLLGLALKVPPPTINTQTQAKTYESLAVHSISSRTHGQAVENGINASAVLALSSDLLADPGVTSVGEGPRSHLAQESCTLSLADKAVVYPSLSRALSKVDTQLVLPVKESPSRQLEPLASPRNLEQVGDDRSPLQRFRSFPRKPLTVSDLTSGAWCELQYWYTLTRLPGGRRTRTAAMKQGSKIHQQLEDEVHTTVRVDVTSKEDGFGLRLWNLIQGMRTLRETGMTRELEVWGMVDDQLVNGVIDGLTHENPNPEFEAELIRESLQGDSRQSRLTDYFPSQRTSQSSCSAPKVYLSDTKTRGTMRPVSAAQLRPSKIQLLLYHRFLTEMAAGRLDLFRVFRRYGLDPDEPFSDAFLAQMASLHDEVFVDAPTSPERPPVRSTSAESVGHAAGSSWSSSASESDLIRYRTLREMASLVEEELARTFPDAEDSLGHILRLQYVHREDGRELDVHDFPVSKQALKEYLDKHMRWWRGERQADGVDIEEAFKCQICEFAPECSWRQGFDQQNRQKALDKMRAPRRAASSGM